MGSGGSGVGSNQGVGSNLVGGATSPPGSQGGSSPYPQVTDTNLNAGSTPGTTLNSNPITPTTSASLPPGIGQMNGTSGGGMPWQVIGYPGDPNTPGWAGSPKIEVGGYNVPLNTDMSHIGTGPGMTAPNNLPPWGLPAYGPNNPMPAPIFPQNPGNTGALNPGMMGRPSTPEGTMVNPAAQDPAYAKSIAQGMLAANNASNSAQYFYDPSTYIAGATADPNSPPDTQAQAQAWAGQSAANAAQAAQWQQQYQNPAKSGVAPTSAPPGTVPSPAGTSS